MSAAKESATPTSHPVRRRTQAERSEATIGHIVNAARELFATEGFANTSIEDVVVAAGVTRGALYHHFTSKTDVFRAVFSAEIRRLDERTIAELQGVEDPWRMVQEAALTAITYCSDPGVHRILFEDAASVLVADEARELRGQGVFQVARGVLDSIMESGEMRRRPIDPIMYMIYGGLRELAGMVVYSDNPEQALADALAEMRAQMDAVRAS